MKLASQSEWDSKWVGDFSGAGVFKCIGFFWYLHMAGLQVPVIPTAYRFFDFAAS